MKNVLKSYSAVVPKGYGRSKFGWLIVICGVTTLLLTSAATSAESTNEPAIRVTMLGTGTPIPKPTQFGPSVLVEAGDTKLLFDCGRGCAHRLWNISPDHLRGASHLFLTHMHSDHTVGVPDLYLNGWNLGRTDNLNVYGPAVADEFMHHIRLAFEEDVVIRADLQLHAVSRETLDYAALEMVDGKTVTIGDARITAIAVDHHVVEPAFGYRIDVGDFSVVISGDTAYSENLVEASTGADVVIHEVFSPGLVNFVRETFTEEIAEDIIALHTLGPEVGRVFSKTQTRLGVLTHLDNSPAGLSGLEDQIKTEWNGDFVVAEDLMIIEIGEEIRIINPSSE